LFDCGNAKKKKRGASRNDNFFLHLKKGGVGIRLSFEGREKRGGKGLPAGSNPRKKKKKGNGEIFVEKGGQQISRG